MADANKVRFGVSNARYAVKGENGYGTWKTLAGAVQVQFAPQGSQNIFYADNMGYYVQNPAAQDQITIELADLTDQAKIDLLGYVQDATSGLLYEPINAKRKEFAFGYQVEGDGTTLRGVRYGGTLSRINETHNTTNESSNPDTQSIEGTFVGDTFTIGNEEVGIIGAACTNAGETHAAYDGFWKAVPVPGTAPAQ